MLRGPLFGNIVFYTIPIILTSLLQLLFNAADLVVVGRFCGSVSVAAVGATGALTNLMVNFFIGLSIGAGVSVAHGLGSHEDEVVHHTVHTAVPTALISGIALTVMGISLCDTFLEMMGTPENVLPLSSVYMKIYFAGITFTMLYNFCAAILRAAGDTKSPLIFLSLAGIVNVVLNVVFVRFFQMNVAGVALATTISQGISAVLVIRCLMKRTDACKLVLSHIRFYKPQLVKILRIGLPAGIQSSLFSISNVLIQSSVNSFGDVFMSGNAAAANLEGFVYASLNAFHQTAVNFIGRFNAYNLLAVFGAAVLLGQKPEEVLIGLSTLHPVAGRFEAIRSPRGFTAIVDYAHTPDALVNVLNAIHGVLEGRGKVITVVGAGGNRDKGKRPMMAKEAARQSDRLILTSDNPRFEEPEDIIRDMQAGLNAEDLQRTLSITDRREAIRTACMLAQPGDVVLVAGKGHEDYQEVKGVKHHFDDKEEILKMVNG